MTLPRNTQQIVAAYARTNGIPRAATICMISRVFWLLAARGTSGLHVQGAWPYVPVGTVFGLSYVCLFEAYARGRVSVVSPIVATESLWAVGLSALLLRQHELVGRKLALGAVAVVAGGALIGAFR